MDLELTRLFVKVIQQGSFSRAAALMRIPKSTVSKAVTRLEKDTGTKLLLRTTRSLTLTAAGKAFYESCLGPIQTLEDAQRSLSGQDSILAGQVKLTAPEDLGNQVIATLIGRLIQEHPSLSFEVNYTDKVVDLVRDGFDLAIRLGKLRESGLKVRKAGEVVVVPVASPKYLKNKPRIQKPQDLAGHSCLSLHGAGMGARWRLTSDKGSVEVSVPTRFMSNQTSSLLKASLAGGGIALIPLFLASPEIEAGRLVRVLPAWRGVTYQVSLLSPLGFSSSARVKIVADRISEVLKQTL